MPELGKAVRRARRARGITQAQLAAAAGLSRNTLNRLENGLFPDLGVKKVQSILEKLGMEVTFRPAKAKSGKDDFAGMASASAVQFQACFATLRTKAPLCAGVQRARSARSSNLGHRTTSN